MLFKKALEYIDSLPNCGFERYGVSGVLALLEKLKNPQKKLNFIHIAGTNGKGSVSTFCAKVLEENKLKVGLYISPYVVGFAERIQINGEYIDEDEFVVLFEKLKNLVEILNKDGIYLTSFDFVTVLAIEYFYEKKCDFVVFEVGMGGRLDSTNVIDAKISIITHIDYDHVKELGGEEGSILNIAKEKAGILKKGGFCIIDSNQYDEVLQFLKLKCEENKIEYKTSYKAEKVCCKADGSCFFFDDVLYKIKLLGQHQVQNAMTAITALVKLKIKTDVIKKGLFNAFIPARFEILKKDPLIVLDGAHNPNGAESLKKTLSLFSNPIKIGVFSVINTKDYFKILKVFVGIFDRIILTKMQDERAVDIELLEKKAKDLNLNFSVSSSFKEAVYLAESLANKDGMVVIFGSLYFAAQVRKLFM